MFKDLLKKMSGLNYSSWLWVVPVLYALHELEEWNVLRWEQAHFVGLPFIPIVGSRLWFLASGAAGFLITWIATRFKNPKITAAITVPVILLTVLNGAQHIFWTIYFRDAAPGVIFGGLLGVPFGLFLVVKAVKDRLVHPVYAAPFAGYAAFAVAQTALLGNQMSPFITNIIPITVWLDALIRVY